MYTLLKFLQYQEVCGTEDRDDTMLVARIESKSGGGDSSPIGTDAWNDAQRRHRRDNSSEVSVKVFESNAERVTVKPIGMPPV